MLKQILGAALTVMIGIGALLPGAIHAQDDDDVQPANIIINTEGVTSYNRATWDDPNADNLALPGTPLHSDDYVLVSGDSTALVICADLSTVELLANGTPECNSNPDNPAFITFDRLDWDPTEIDILVTDEIVLPDGIDEIDNTTPANNIDLVNDYASAIQQLPVNTDAQMYARAYMLASNGLYLDAINALQELEGLQCTEQRPFVEIDDVTITSSPTTYLRLGEWFAIAGNTEISERYLQCATEAAGEIGDDVTYALALVRLATLSGDADVAAGLYQEAIDRFDSLTATEAMETLLDLCGSANCTRPE